MSFTNNRFTCNKSDWNVFRSVVINHLEEIYKQDNVGIVYVYCTYREVAQSATNLLSSLLKQLLLKLLQQRRPISSSIIDLHKHHRDKETRPSLSEYSRLLATELRHFSKAFIVIDALDECAEEGRIGDQFLTEVRKLLPSVSLLVTSRNIPDMERKFEVAARLDIYASDGDIKCYLKDRMKGELAKFVKGNTTLQTEILTTITEKAQGM